VAGRQLGVVSSEQLHDLGFSLKQIARMVAEERLLPIHYNVFAVGHKRLVPRARLLAAQLTFGPTSFLSHRTAAAVWGLRAINTHEIEVTVPGGGGRERDGVVVHRTRTAGDVRMNGDLRVSSIMRTLIELAPREQPAELDRLITVAVQKRLLRPEAADSRAAINDALQRYERWPRAARLRAALAGYTRVEDRKSKLERDFERFLKQHPEIPKPVHNVDIDHWEVDCFWPAYNLAVELDGRPYHVAFKNMEKDRVKDAALHRLGLTPLRYTDYRFEHDRSGILSDLRHFLNVSR
jgi:very-short-patch-repair endonuclease